MSKLLKKPIERDEIVKRERERDTLPEVLENAKERMGAFEHEVLF